MRLAVVFLCGFGAFAAAGFPLNPSFTPEAVKEYKAKADAGDAEAQCLYSAALILGEGVGPNVSNAFRRGAEFGRPRMACNLARCQWAGLGVERNEKESVKWFRRAAEGGCSDAQNVLAWMYFHGKGVRKNMAEAVKWYRKASESCGARGRNRLRKVSLFEKGFVAKSFDGVRWYWKDVESENMASLRPRLPALASGGNASGLLERCRNCAERGNAEAQYELGWMHYFGEETAKDESAAVQWFRKAAEQGHADAQNALGWMLHWGNGTGRNETESVQWYHRAAQQGDVEAQMVLAGMYSRGVGVSRDVREAAHWYRKAAEGGFPEAKRMLGRMCLFGEGVAKSEEEGVGWYRKAAELGDAEAQHTLGWLYYFGEGVETNAEKAVMWFRKAAEKGNAEAQNTLGWMYFFGQGVKADGVMATLWYWRAARQGNANARENLSRIESKDRDAVPKHWGVVGVAALSLLFAVWCLYRAATLFGGVWWPQIARRMGQRFRWPTVLICGLAIVFLGIMAFSGLVSGNGRCARKVDSAMIGQDVTDRMLTTEEVLTALGHRSHGRSLPPRIIIPVGLSIVAIFFMVGLGIRTGILVRREKRRLVCWKCGGKFDIRAMDRMSGSCPHCRAAIPISDYCVCQPEERWWRLYSAAPLSVKFAVAICITPLAFCLVWLGLEAMMGEEIVAWVIFLFMVLVGGFVLRNVVVGRVAIPVFLLSSTIVYVYGENLDFKIPVLVGLLVVGGLILLPFLAPATRRWHQTCHEQRLAFALAIRCSRDSASLPVKKSKLNACAIAVLCTVTLLSAGLPLAPALFETSERRIVPQPNAQYARPHAAEASAGDSNVVWDADAVAMQDSCDGGPCFPEAQAGIRSVALLSEGFVIPPSAERAKTLGAAIRLILRQAGKKIGAVGTNGLEKLTMPYVQLGDGKSYEVEWRKALGVLLSPVGYDFAEDGDFVLLGHSDEAARKRKALPQERLSANRMKIAFSSAGYRGGKPLRTAIRDVSVNSGVVITTDAMDPEDLFVPPKTFLFGLRQFCLEQPVRVSRTTYDTKGREIEWRIVLRQILAPFDYDFIEAGGVVRIAKRRKIAQWAWAEDQWRDE